MGITTPCRPQDALEKISEPPRRRLPGKPPKHSREAAAACVLGGGGSAGNCGHAVNDFRKIVGIEAYAPTGNVFELTARTNDEGQDWTYPGFVER